MSTSEQDVKNYVKRKLEEAEKKIAETNDQEKAQAHWMRQAEVWGRTVRELLQKSAGNDFVTRALGHRVVCT